MNSFFRVLIRIEFILVYLYCLESHLEDHMVFLGLMLGPLAFSPNCSLLLGFQDARHKKNAFSGSRRALESFFHNATVAGIPADGRFINAALRYYGDDITAPLTAWKSDIHPASDQGSPDEPSQSKEHAWCAGASFFIFQLLLRQQPQQQSTNVDDDPNHATRPCRHLWLAKSCRRLCWLRCGRLGCPGTTTFAPYH
jgi:hypothetical protein